MIKFDWISFIGQLICGLFGFYLGLKTRKGKDEKMISVVDIHKTNGVRLSFDVYIGRRIQYHKEFTQDSKWANRFYQDLEGYERYIRDNLWDDLDELKGKVLGCWCVTTNHLEPVQCHGQILMKLLQEKEG